MKRLFLSLLALMSFAMGWSQTCCEMNSDGTFVQASDPQIQYVGRVSWRKADVASFNFPGTEIRARFSGTSLKMVCRPMTGYFMAIVDGSKAFKVGFNAPKDSVVTVAAALTPGEHTVRLQYAIEGWERHPEFKGFILDADSKLLPSAPLPTLKLEFIGNSITCGFGVENPVASGPFEEETENHWYTYANIVTDSLHAIHTSISRSGIGVYRNYDGPREGSAEPMPTQYPYTLFNDHSERWDFSRYTPDIVFINLGTNDLSTNNYDIHRYEQAYRAFLATVRGYYLKARIILLSGPMLGAKDNEAEKAVLNRIAKDFRKKGDKLIERFDFTPQDGSLGYGASWHPSKRQHQKMAEELLDFLRKNVQSFAHD